MRTIPDRRILAIIVVGLASAAPAVADDEPPGRWDDTAAAYRLEIDAGKPAPLAFRKQPALKWTNPARKADEGAVFIWTDRGRPEVAASFYQYKSKGNPFEDHEFVSLSTAPLSARLEGEIVWSLAAGNVEPKPIPDAPKPAATAVERLRQMKALAREFKATYNNPPDLSEIRLLTQPLYRFETEGQRSDVLDGALFAYVHTTDPEVLLILEARKPDGGTAMAWHASFARMSMVNMRVHHKDREVWSCVWDNRYRGPDKPYMVRSRPSKP